jgi:glycosyltransferase involved in cell wall biosynthesis
VNVLITLPPLDRSGGVANYYIALRRHLGDGIKYFEIGARSGEVTLRATIGRLVSDFWRFHRELDSREYELVHVNPSLGAKSVIRDGLFVLLAKWHRRKVLVFFRGWDSGCEETIRRYFLGIFRRVFGRADAVVVLANEFRERLREMEFGLPIFVATTVVDDRLLLDTADRQVLQNSKPRLVRILFLSRLEKGKGLPESIKAYQMLREKHPDTGLIVAGDGPERQAAEQLVAEKNIAGVQFLGYVEGEAKRRAYSTADIFVFPSSYGEGMPNAVLEAMAFGLPIITSPVGGIRDFFEDNRMGFVTASKDPAVIAKLLARLVEDSSLRDVMGEFNRRYAAERFSAPVVAEKLLDIYEQVRTAAK